MRKTGIKDGEKPGGVRAPRPVRLMVYTALLTAMGVALPQLFHTLPGAGAVFLPMHLTVLLCGLACGWPYGMACGLMTPLLSSLLTTMPPAALLPSMLCELAVYGTLTGLLMRVIRTSRPAADILLSMTAAMLAGRVFYGVLNAAIFQAGSYSLQLWLTAAFIKAFPGILLHILLVPPVVYAMLRARLIDRR